MLYVAAILAAIFLGFSFVLTEKNARYLLSGYNTMSAQERAKVDIKNYVPFFKDFHRKLAVTFFLGTFGLWYINHNWASLFMVTFPLLAYIYFLWKGISFFPKPENKIITYIPMGILLVVTMVVGLMTVRDFKGNELIIEGNHLIIKGSFGLTLRREDIKGIKMVSQWPDISYKLHGFAAGYAAKGSFKTKDGEVVRLFIDKRYEKALQFDTYQGLVYYNVAPSKLNFLYDKVADWYVTTPTGQYH